MPILAGSGQGMPTPISYTQTGTRSFNLSIGTSNLDLTLWLEHVKFEKSSL